MVRILVMGVCVVLLVFAPSPAGAAQPTFGRPKESRPRSPGDARPPAGDASLSQATEPWREHDPPRLAPSSDAKTGEAYAWRSADGLRFAWRLPLNAQPSVAYDAVVFLHPARADFRWGLDNLMGDPGPAGAQHARIVISVDGVASLPGRENVRTWEGSDDQALRFRDFLLQMTRELPVQRVYLAGYGAGGSFAAYFAMRFPAVADGVVVQSAALFEGEPKGKTNVPMIFLHGSADSVTPLAVAFDARASCEEAGTRTARVRVMPEYNDFASPVRIGECVDYLVGIRSNDAGEVLEAARAMLTPKPADETDYQGPVWFAGAREVLLRLTGEQEGVDEPLEDVPGATRAEAEALLKRLDAHAEAHLKILRPAVGQDAALLGPDGGDWLGHLLAVREDFRGFPGVESWIAQIGFDAVQAEHRRIAREFTEAWAPTAVGAEAERMDLAAEAIPGAMLSWTLPLDAASRCRVWGRRATELKLSEESLKSLEAIENVERGLRSGIDAYQRLWQEWSLE